MRAKTFLLAGIIIGTFSCVGAAAIDKADLTVGMKTLPLLSNKLSGNVRIAVVFDAAQESSRREAEAVKSIIDGGLELPGDLNTSAVLVSAGDAEKMQGSRIAVIMPNMRGYYDAISSISVKYGILTISTDLDCVRENKCVLGIISKPHVEIYYSSMAAENARISFEQAFTILAKPASLIANRNP